MKPDPKKIAKAILAIKQLKLARVLQQDAKARRERRQARLEESQGMKGQ